MKKQNKILFPTDFSDAAANAFRYALLLADTLEFDLELIHSVYPQTESLDIPVMTAEATMAKTDFAAEAMKAFIETGLTQLAWQLHNAPNIVSNIEIGSPIQTILRVAARDQISLIVMGTQGEHKGLDRLWGNVAAGVVAQAPCAVMVVPKLAPFKKPVNIAYATDISDSDPFEIWKMIQLLKPFQPHIHCVHFSLKDKLKAKEERVEQMENFLQDRAATTKTTFHHLPGTSLEEDLNRFVEDQDIDLLVMFQPKRSLLERIFHRSNVRKMAVNTRVPLLVQKEGA